MTATRTFLALPCVIVLQAAALAQAPPGEAPALGDDRVSQGDIQSGALTLDEVRAAGLKIFAVPFNKLDGFGDGPVDGVDNTSPGRRPSLQNNGTFLRINGLDAQSCLECHAVGSNATVPFTFAVGGAGGSNNNAIAQPREIDVDDEAGLQYAFFDGRFINPPFLFGSGGIELVGKEMTEELLRRKAFAQANPGLVVPLSAKGVDFGEISYDDGTGTFDTSGVEGVDEDLVIRPFGRKGEFATVRGFDLGAMNFHFGMQPVEEVGAGVDGDADGVVDEILVGEMSALHVFGTNLERPLQDPLSDAALEGELIFGAIGCAGCHVPSMETTREELTYSFPEVDDDPFDENVYYSVNLVSGPSGFASNGSGGVVVESFSDFKRHDMGPELAESVGGPLDAQFITPRLWGLADTAPYLHDGRATTLTEAILLHGGEAQAVRDVFDSLSDGRKESLLEYLRSLRTPVDPAGDLF